MGIPIILEKLERLLNQPMVVVWCGNLQASARSPNTLKLIMISWSTSLRSSVETQDQIPMRGAQQRWYQWSQIRWSPVTCNINQLRSPFGPGSTTLVITLVFGCFIPPPFSLAWIPIQDTLPSHWPCLCVLNVNVKGELSLFVNSFPYTSSSALHTNPTAVQRRFPILFRSCHQFLTPTIFRINSLHIRQLMSSSSLNTAQMLRSSFWPEIRISAERWGA